MDIEIPIPCLESSLPILKVLFGSNAKWSAWQKELYLSYKRDAVISAYGGVIKFAQYLEKVEKEKKRHLMHVTHFQREEENRRVVARQEAVNRAAEMERERQSQALVSQIAFQKGAEELAQIFKSEPIPIPQAKKEAKKEQVDPNPIGSTIIRQPTPIRLSSPKIHPVSDCYNPWRQFGFSLSDGQKAGVREVTV